MVKKKCPIASKCPSYQEGNPLCDEDGGKWMEGYLCGILKNNIKYHLYHMTGEEEEGK